MAKDFKASQIRTTQIIASGSASGKPALMIVSASSPGVDFDGGGINNATTLAGVGKDVFIFISGSKSSKDSSTVQGVTVFGGDIVVSGTAYNASGGAFGGVAGSNTQVQFNDGGNFGADSGLTFNKTTDTLSVGNVFITGSLLSVSGSVVIAQDLTVNGTTTTVNTTNLVVKDPIIYFGSSSAAGTTQGGIALASGSSIANQAMVFGKIATNTWGAGRLDVQAGQATSMTTMEPIALRVAKLELGNTNSFLTASSNTLVIDANGGTYISSSAEFERNRSLSFREGASIQFTSESAGLASISFGSAAENALNIANASYPGQTSITMGAVHFDGLDVGVSFFKISGSSESFDSTTFDFDVRKDNGSLRSLETSDVNFFVTGSKGSKGTNTRGTALFGGDVVISGTLHGGSPLKVSGSMALSGSLRLQTQDSAPTVGSNESVLYVLNDGGTKKLYWKNSDNTQQQIGTGGASSGTFNEPSPAEFVTTASVSIAGGRGFNFTADSVGTDTYFFVSGTIGSKNTSTKGTSVFGGDIAASGTFFAPSMQLTGTAGSSSILGSLDVSGPVRTSKLELGGTSIILTSSDGQQLTIAGGGGSSIRIIPGSEGLRLGNISGPVAISGSNVRFGNDSAEFGNEIPPQPGADSYFFVSGATGFRGSDVRSVAVFGGDLVHSGSVFGGVNSSLGRTLLNSIASTIILDNKERQIQSTIFDKSDIFFYVSGSVGSKGTSERGTSVFGGDVVLSGSLHGDGNRIFVTSSIAALATDRTGLSLRQGNGDASITLSGSLNNPGLFGDSVSRPYITTETTNQNIAFVLKGGTNTRVEFIPDDDVKVKAFISGSGYISGTTIQAAALSGSLTKLADGTSYLIAGSNVTITTGSNGAVTIASTGGGGGDSFFSSTTNDSIFTTGSVAIRGGESSVDSPSDKGSDVFFYVSGTQNQKGSAVGKTSMFGGDVVISGVLHGGVNSFTSDTLLNLNANNIVLYGGSVQQEATKSDISLFVSGAIGSKNGANKGTAVFGGDVVISGTLHGGSPLKIAGGMQLTGTLDIANDSNSKITVTAISGSLTKLANGTSYLIAGDNVTITTGSNGAVTIASTGGGGGGSGDANATYLVLSATGSLNNERVITAGTGISTNDAGAGGNYTISINDSVVATVSGTTFTGVVKANSGFSGSLTQLVDGTSYLIAGTNVVITTGSSGAVTIASTGGGGDSFFTSTTQFSIFTTGSTALVGTEAGIDSPQDKGADVFFYVSGSKNSKDGAIPGVSMFGGDLMLSGSTYVASGSSILPVVDRGSDLGSAAKRWGNVYTGDLHLRNDRGDWTIVEEEDYLCVVNNKTGKKFKMALIPLEE